MVAGTDSIDGMALLRHGGMKRVFTDGYAPSTLGSFLQSFYVGLVREMTSGLGRYDGQRNRLGGGERRCQPSATVL